MFKLAITVLAMASLALASEQKAEYNDHNDAHPASQAHHSGYYYPYYGYYPYYNYHPAPYYYHPGYYYHPAYVPYDHHYQHHAPAHYPGLVFIGKFEGTCRGAANGIYFVDDRSFAYCSNGIKTIQSCADGSANPAYSKFEKGRYYQFSEFCSVNLVAQQQVPGYDVHHSAEVKQQEKAAQY